ncbi:transcription elongation factor GreAB [Luteolibacter sp. AS25]|uniref:transcription elongation factor GreAB n=1 Tax=Luteolibacter sp. AS25 TaxID=3135776 RepID=UPI00398B8260
MKADLLEIIRSELRGQLDRLARAASAAHAAATDPGSKAESKYDTRSLEESYLATGQARQVRELAANLQAFDNIKPRAFDNDDEIDAGALVETKRKGQRKAAYFFLAPAAGGLEVMLGKKEITLLSPESPLYQNLLGKFTGDTLEMPPLTISGIR